MSLRWALRKDLSPSPPRRSFRSAPHTPTAHTHAHVTRHHRPPHLLQLCRLGLLARLWALGLFVDQAVQFPFQQLVILVLRRRRKDQLINDACELCC
jgi:hypothetical protein